MVEQHEQQHVETMLATHQLRDGEPLLGTGTRAAARAGCCRPTPCWCRPGRSCWASTATPSPGRSTTSVRPTPSTCPPSASRGCRSPTASGSAFIDAGGYDEPRWWSAPWLAAPARRRPRAAAVLVRRRLAAPVRPRRGDPGRRAGAARLLLRGRGLRRLGRRPAPHRAGVGEGVRLGSRRSAAGAAGRGATRTGRRPWPTSAATRSVPPRSAPTRPARRRTASSR